MMALSAAVLLRFIPRRCPKTEFTLSYDCENLFDGNTRYEFAGFSESKKSLCNAYSKLSHSVIGKKIGYILDENRTFVYSLALSGGDYVMVRGKQDSWDIFRRVS